MTEEKPGVVLVTLHGVGAPERGTILESLLGAASGAVTPGAPRTDTQYERRDLLIDGVTFPRAVGTKSSPFQAVIEVNWADVAKPQKGPLGTLRHLVLLILAMLWAQPGAPGERDAQPWYRRVYRYFFETVFIWCLWPLLSTLLVASSPTWIYRAAALILAPVAVWIIAHWLSTYTRQAKAGYAWGLAALTGGWLSLSIDRLPTVVFYAAFVYSTSQALAVVLLLVVCSSIFSGLWRGPTADQVFTRLAFTYGPAVGITMVGSVLWLAALRLTGAHRPTAWDGAFLKGLRYDLGFVEHATTIAVGMLPLIAAIGAIAYEVRRRSGRTPRSGVVAQSAMSVMLRVAPVILMVPAVILLCSWAAHPHQSTSDGILAVYQQSALRILPYVLMALSPMGVLLDVLGDVAFYLVPDSSELSVVKRTVPRLAAVIRHVADSKCRLMLLCHSQGSIIALKAMPPSHAGIVITAGSPIQSLYRRFLGYDVVPAGERTWHWINALRRDDYIGGAIREPRKADAEWDLGPGGHTNYWVVPCLWKRMVGVSQSKDLTRGNVEAVPAGKLPVPGRPG